MKTLKLEWKAVTRVGVTKADEVAIALGPDGQPRIAAHVGKSVFFVQWTPEAGRSQPVPKPVLVASATVKGPQFLSVVDVYAISVASTLAGDVVTGRGRTKGSGNDTYHGPWMTRIVKDNGVQPLQFCGFTTGAVRPVIEPGQSLFVELWSKDGAYRYYNVVKGTDGTAGKDKIGKTGEKLAVYPGGWRAFGGCSTFDNSRVMQRGKWPAVDVVDCDTFKGAGDDVYGSVSICVKKTPQKEVCYFAAEMMTGTIRINKVVAGRAVFPIRSLPSIGQASRVARHPAQLCIIQGRAVCFWTLKGRIMAVDVDQAIAGRAKPLEVCAGDKAAAVSTGKGAMLAVLRGGEVVLVEIHAWKD